MNPPFNLNLTVIEPPLKRFKKQLEKFSNSLDSVSNSVERIDHREISKDFDLEIGEKLINGALEAVPNENLLENWRNSLSKDGGSAINESEFTMFSDEILSETDFKEASQDFDFELDELSMIDQEQCSVEQFSNYSSNDQFHRVKILKIVESYHVKDGQKFQYPQKTLECLILKNDACVLDFAPIKVIVRDDWLHCKLVEEGTINVLGSIVNGEIFIDNDKNYIVIEPDILINTTAVADSFSCSRRAVISYRTQPSVEDNKPNVSMVCGSIVHELVEGAFRSGDYSLDLKRLNELILRNIEAIFCCEKDEKFVREKVVEIMTSFPKWCSLYLRKVPAIHAHVIDQIKCNNHNSKNPTKSTSSAQDKSICISKVLDLEENIWSVMFGLKGKVDATVQMKYKKDGEMVEVICPFELKTGHSTTSVAHRAQTLLYTLMLHDRYRKPIDFGLLYYISTGDLIRISGWRDEIRSILIARNRLAENLAQTDRLPEQIRNEFLCKKCFQVDACVMYHSLSEMGTSQTSSVPKIFEEKTQHLTTSNEKYNKFFTKWIDLITLEEAETIKTRSEIWRFDSENRFKRGKCLKGMRLISSEKVSDYKYSSKFVTNEQDYSMKSLSLLNSYISEGDLVVISGEAPSVQYAISTGVVGILKADIIEIFTDRDMLILGDSKVNQGNRLNEVSFCIDKNELTGSFGLLRANLLKLFSLESQKLLNFVVDLKVPRFSMRSTVDRCVLEEFGLLQDFESMDSDQKEAFYRSIETLDYLLILGMPGTGKTTTLSFIIRYLVLVLGKSILISSHTHSALDHIGMKLQEKNLPFLRIGNEDKIDKSIESNSLLINKKFSTVSEVEHCYSTARVVICTSFGMNHSLFMRKRFDYCLVDEASQLTLPACIGALRVAQAFILVGDHYQLPPLVRSKEALKGGFGESLFKTLADSHPSAMVKLCNQYRMNDEIMLMANRLTYQNLLKCASDCISAQTLLTRSKPQIEVPWIARVLNPSCKVVFLNTDSIVECHEVKNGNSFHNEIESKIIEQLVKSAVVDYGVARNQISLISPYRPQLKYLNFDESIEVSTIDKYQGRDCDCVVISLVRSNPDGNIGELLTDWQRLNVAFTRSKKKLVLIGSVRTVLNNPAFKKLKDLVEERDWLIDLPSDALSL